MSDKRILERVKKLLAMAADTSSPEEAAIAARRASKLMEQHSITQAEVLTRDEVDDRISSNASDEGYKRMPFWYEILGIPVAKLYDCEVRRSAGEGGKWHAEFLGFDEDTVVAVWVLDYLRIQIETLANSYRRNNEISRSEMHEFRLGCSRAICQMLKEELEAKQARMRNQAPGKGLMVMKNELINEKFNVSYRRGAARAPYTASYAHGLRAGASVSLRQGIHSQGQQRL